MDLLDLPIELFRKVLEQTAFTLDLMKAFQLRLVCKLIDKEIPFAIHNARLLDDANRPNRAIFLPPQSWILSEHIFRSTWTRDYGNDNLPAAIHLAIRTLVGEAHVDEKKDCVRRLCKAAILFKGTKILEYLKSGTEVEYLTKIEQMNSASAGGGRGVEWDSTTNHITSAAACLGKQEFFTQIVADGGEIDFSENLYFGQPLRCAITNGHYDLTKFLLDHGADVNYAESGHTALQAAASQGRKDLVALILDSKYGCTRSEKSYGHAIGVAASAGHLEVVQLLMQHNHTTPWEALFNDLLLLAARHGHEDIVRFTLQLGADPNAENLSYRYPITEAARHGYHRIVKILLENGAVVRIGGRQDTRFWAAKYRYKRVLDLLSDYGIVANTGPGHPWEGMKIEDQSAGEKTE